MGSFVKIIFIFLYFLTQSKNLYNRAFSLFYKSLKIKRVKSAYVLDKLAIFLKLFFKFAGILFVIQQKIDLIKLLKYQSVAYIHD